MSYPPPIEEEVIESRPRETTRERIRSQRLARVRRRRKTLLQNSLAIIFILALMILIFWPSLTRSGIPSGVDTPSFLHTAKFVVDYFKEHRALPPTDPYWYSGHEHLHYAPPLIYIPIGLFYLLTDNIRLAGKIFQILMVTLAALNMFFVVKKRHGVYSALVAAVVFPLAPWTFFQLGSPTKLLAALFFPVCFHYTEKVLDERKNKYIVILAVLFLVVLLSHPMMGLIFMAGMAVYSMVYSGLSPDKRFSRSFAIILAAISGVALGSYYIIPFYVEKAGWTAIPYQELVNYSHPLDRSLLYTGVPLIILGLYSVFKHRDARKIGLLVIGVMGWFLSLGIFGSGFMYEHVLPLLKLTYPGLWLNLPVFAFAYLSATAIDFEAIKGTGEELKRAVIAVTIIAVSLFAFDRVDHFTMLTNFQSQLADRTISAKLNELDNTGRVAPMKYPFGYLIWELGDRTDKHIFEGHYFGLARIARYISWNYDAIDNGFVKYPVQVLARHNVKYLIANGNLLNSRKGYGQKFLDELEKAGFNKKFSIDDYYTRAYDLYEKEGGSSYLVPVTEKVLAIGNYAYIPAALFSDTGGKVLTGGSPYLDDYSAEVLENFDTLILYGFAFRDRKKAEALVEQFVKEGRQVVIDLHGVKPYLLEADPTFLGVTGYQRIAKGTFSIEVSKSREPDLFAYQVFELPSELVFSGSRKQKLKEWRYLVYNGLDEPVAFLKGEDHKDMFSIAGYKKVGKGQVLFIGPNLFYHTYLTHDKEEIRLLSKALNIGSTSASRGVKRTTKDSQASVKIIKESIKPAKLTFEYEAQKDFPALVSYAFSTHWAATLDGRPIELSNLEELMFLNLPGGRHDLTISYQGTRIHTYAWGITLMAAAFFAWLIYHDRKLKPKEVEIDGK